MKSYIIGFGYKKGAGKTTSAKYIQQKLVGDFPSSVQTFLFAFGSKIKSVANHFGWDGEKDEKGRRLLQEVGDIGRHYNPNIWINFVLDEIIKMKLVSDLFNKQRVYLVDDIRFEEEAEALKNLEVVDQTFIIRMDRDTGSNDSHRSEHGMDNYNGWDLVIDNNGTMEELYEKLDGVIKNLTKEVE